MHRRTILTTGVAAVTGMILMPVTALADTGVTAGLDALLFGPRRKGTPAADLGVMAKLVRKARLDFAACRYRELAAALPDLIRTAEATRDSMPNDRRSTSHVLVSDSYILAAELLTKLHENGAAWAGADRGVQAAIAADDPRALARAQRRAVVVLRRSQHRDAAAHLMLSTARGFATATDFTEPSDANFYADMLCTASYTAALAGDRSTAYDLLAEARAVVTEHPGPGFGHNDIALYWVGVARAVGDCGLAVESARQVNLDQFVTAERHARYWEDAALAWHGRGRPEYAYRALLNAEQVAPQEVRFRPWATQLTLSLLEGGTTLGMSGLRDFAQRIGVN